MATLRELLVKVGVQVDDKALDSLDQGLEKTKKSALVLGAAIVGISAAMFGATKSAADYADKIDDTSMRLGVARDELQKLAYASQLSGGDFQLLTIGLTRITDRVKLLNQGNKEAQEVYASMGIEVKNTDGSLKNSNEILLDLADVFSKMPDGIKKTELAMRAIGPEAGPRLIPMLNAGRAGIEAMGAEAENLGMIMDDASIAAGSNFNDALDSLLGTFTGIKNTIGAKLFPVMTELLASFKQLIIANQDLIKTGLSNFVSGLITTVDIAGTAFSHLARIISFLTSNVGGLVPVLKTLGALFLLYQAGSLAMGIMQIVKGFMLMRNAIILTNIAAMAIPILIGIAVAALVLIIDDLFAFMDGKPSFLGYLLENKEQIMQGIQDFLKGVLFFVLEFFGISRDTTQSFITWYRDMFIFVIEAISNAFNTFSNLVSSIFSTIAAILRGELFAAFDEWMTLLGNIFSPFTDSWKVAFGIISRGLISLKDLAVNTFNSLKDTISDSFVGDVLKFTGVISKEDTPVQNIPQTFADVGQTISQSPAISNNASTFNNQSSANQTMISPTINITMSGASVGGANQAENIADLINKEITKIGQTVARNNEPIFSD
jgi:hypothetical protein